MILSHETSRIYHIRRRWCSGGIAYPKDTFGVRETSCLHLGTLLPSTYYLVAQDKNTRQIYVITDIHSSPFDAYDFRATVRSESDRIYIAFDNASLYVCSSDFIYNCSISHNSPYNKAKMIRFCELPNNTLNLAHKVMLLDAINYDKAFKNMSSLSVPKIKCPYLTKRA